METASKFVIGGVYYSIGLRMFDGQIGALVGTWIYRGIASRPYSSASCDVDGQFYAFESAIVVGESVEPLPTRLVPSLKQAVESYFTWNEFCAEVQDASEQLK